MVNGKTVTLDIAATKIKGRTFVPARFVAESFGADVKWDDSRKQVIITTGTTITPEGQYYFVYNSQKVTSQDMASIKLFANRFKQTHNVLFDAAKYKTATELYDALKAQQKKLGGSVTGVQIFGVVDDVPAFTYTQKMKMIVGNERWDGVATNTNEKFSTDFFYSTFKNDVKHLKDVSVYGIIQEKLPISIVPEWPVSRLPLTKGEISGYIAKYDEYRKQTEEKSLPTVVLSAPTMFHENGHGINDVALFLKRLKDEQEFGLFKNTDLRTYYKDLAANLIKENKAGVMDLVVGSDGDSEGATQNKVPFLNRKSVASLNANYYTAFFWNMAPGKEALKGTGFLHDGLTEGKMINPIASVTLGSNGNIENYVWATVPVPEGESGDNRDELIALNKELMEERNSMYFFAYKYYEALQDGKTRLESFYKAKVAFASLSASNKDTVIDNIALVASHGYEYVISLHYLGLADYE